MGGLVKADGFGEGRLVGIGVMDFGESWMAEQRTSEACKIGDLVTGFVDRLSPVCRQYDSVAQAWEGLLPETLRAHSRIAGVSNGCLKVMADGSSYMFELQLCKAVLLRELQRLCPSARVRRIELGMAR